jgi:SulP family sulfate permease
MARTRHDPDAELIAQGIGNLLVPFWGGIAATGAIARTATNVKAGGRSPLAAMTHSLTIFAAVLSLAPLLGYLPMATLAALLPVVAWLMSVARHVRHMLRVAPRSDVAVLLVCFSLTVGFDMVVGVSVGMVHASFLFMRRMAEVTHMRAAPADGAGYMLRVPPGVEVYEISGPLFFGAAQKAMATLEIICEGTRVVIVDMSRANAIDATGLVAFESAMQILENHRCPAVLANVQTQPREVFRKAKLDSSGNVYYCESLMDAADLAERLLSKKSERPSGTPQAEPLGTLP